MEPFIYPPGGDSGNTEEYCCLEGTQNADQIGRISDVIGIFLMEGNDGVRSNSVTNHFKR